MKPTPMVRELIGYDVRGVEIFDHGLQHIGGSLSDAEIPPASGLRYLSKNAAPVRRIFRVAEIDGVDQRIAGDNRFQSVSGRSSADSVVAVGKKNENRFHACSAAMRNEICAKCERIE